MKTLLSAIAFLLVVNGAVAQNLTDGNSKKNAAPLENSSATLSQLEPVSYEYSKDKDAKKLDLPTGKQTGFLVEDMERIYPQAVKTTYKMVPAGKNYYKSVAVKVIDYNSLIPLLVASMKEQQEELDSLKREMQRVKVVTR